MLPFDSAVVIVAERGQDVVEVAKQFGRIGFDHVSGVVYDLDPWVSANGPLASFELRTADDLFDALRTDSPPQVLDVRSPGDWEMGHLDGSFHRYTPALKEGVPSGLDTDADVWIVCATGFRAMAASTYLEAEGFRPVVVAYGGVPDILHRLATGAAD